MFEVSIDTLGCDVYTPSQSELDNGAAPHVTVQAVASVSLPIVGNANRPLKAPVAVINIPLNKAAALELAKLIKEEAEKLPSSGSVSVASSMQEAEREAKLLEEFRSKT